MKGTSKILFFGFAFALVASVSSVFAVDKDKEPIECDPDETVICTSAKVGPVTVVIRGIEKASTPKPVVE